MYWKRTATYVACATLFVSILRTLIICLLLTFGGLSPVLQAQSIQQHPNILFIVMDDVGIDQLKSFGYGGLTPPPTPVLDAVAQNGIRFRNVWAMPECSPSRAMFYEGRYPFRTNVFAAIVESDLANSQVSPYEVTTPRVLKQANYESAMIGKFHLTGPTNNPYGDEAPLALGWDYFYGYLDAAPPSIDTTAGGVAQAGTYSCGFVPSKSDSPKDGADTGACYFPGNRGCQAISTSMGIHTPGRACLEQGGIFVPNESCQAVTPSNVDFNRTNAYYVWPRVINRKSDGTVSRLASADPQSRTYSTVDITNRAIDWIHSQPKNRPWMATVAYPNMHTPYQQPPSALLPAHSVPSSGLNCGRLPDQRVLGNQMVTAMDTEIGRLLVNTGLATRNSDGHLDYDPSANNTMVIIIGDNGTLANSVKAPFDPLRSKGSVYQTGVWVPLIVAGPLVNSPGRDDTHMVNVADLFELFGEIAGLNVHDIVPSSHQLDSVAMLPYLVNPAQPSLRQYNFTQIGDNLRAAGSTSGVCVLGNTCNPLVTTESLCTDNGGEWHDEVASCCALLQNEPTSKYTISPELQSAIRNDKFKLVETKTPNCDTGGNNTTDEFYTINEAVPLPKIDYSFSNLLVPNGDPLGKLTPDQRANYDALYAEMQRLMNSESSCPGDGNLDKIVNDLDIGNWAGFENKGSSWYDFNLDGKTDQLDLNIILQNLNKHCR